MRNKMILVLAVCLIFVLAASAGAATVVKQDLAGVPADKADKIFNAFAQVPLYYLVTEDGNGMMDQYSQEAPEELPGLLPKPPEGFVITLYYDKGMAEEMAALVGKKEGIRYVVRTAPMEVILHKQYEMIGLPPSTDPANPVPDFLIVDNPFRVAAFPEYLADAKTNEPYVTGDAGARFIPAFIAHNTDAIKLQEGLGGEKAYVRVGQDFKSFLGLVEKYSGTDTPVVVFFGSQLSQAQ
ncbi:MAG: hypothetical protein Q8Q08_01090 [Candidatus Omnitrophota bacterium]|nr:hypothetical protein [Candidatus Omnitrophota bacterium]MDZ4241269.1 hypothetical protein [Candidatus Omnitrophota bacterium]